MKILTIDTSSNKDILISLKVDDEKFMEKQKLDTSKAQAALPMIEKILSEKKIALEDLDGIEVNTGPGSFTGLRVGIAIANALSFALKIPVNGKNPPPFAEPRYK